jgi:uncharacterized protein with FMN-binding domain
MSDRRCRRRRSLKLAAAAIPLICAAAPNALPVVDAATAAPFKTYAGPPAGMKFGPVRVAIEVSGMRIISISATAPTSHPRSMFINNKAVPILRREVLQTQSARIHAVSGATLTSQAFYSSLLGALHAAHLQ